jgi:hypothetical protein
LLLLTRLLHHRRLEILEVLGHLVADRPEVHQAHRVGAMIGNAC